MQFKHYISATLLGLATQTQAIDFISTNIYSVAKDQTVKRELWISAGSVQTEGTFKNDLFVFSGSNLLLDGTYEGNVWGMGGIKTGMGGDCSRNMRLTGRTIEVRGSIGQNLMAMADTIVVSTNATVGGDLKLMGNSIVVEGHTAGNAAITSTRLVTLGGTIDGDVEIAAPDILFSRGTRILGNMAYTAAKEIVPPEGAVMGKLERVVPKAPPTFSTNRLFSHTMWFIGALMAGIPFITLFPMTTAMASQLVRTKPFKCLLVGCISFGALPILGIISVSSVIGVPLGVLTLASWGILFYLARIIMGLMIGTFVLRHGYGNSVGRILTAMALGLAIIYIATFFPSIGMAVQLGISWMGIGALLLALLQKRRLIIQVPQELKQIEQLKHQNQQQEES